MLTYTREQLIKQIDGRLKDMKPGNCTTVCADALISARTHLLASMPEEPTRELLECMLFAYNRAPNYEGWDKKWLSAYQALRAALTTPPKPKMRKEWCFYCRHKGREEFHVFHSEKAAQDSHDVATRDNDHGYSDASPIFTREVEDK